MTLNPFFLQGSPGEQRLVQDLINEQLKMYGVEVIYIPRKFVKKETILKEVSSSKFDDNYAIEAYVNTYDGYSGQGDILTKFGMNLKDELNVVISRERYEDFIAPFIDPNNIADAELGTRPKEGDLIYFPLGQKLFEVKFVEHEQPFYQLGKLYVYELKCELFEYEDEVIDTTIYEIDTQIQEEGYITTLNLVGFGSTASAVAGISSGYIRKIFLNNDGYGYTTPPTVSISTAPSGGTNASAVAITTIRGGIKSVKEILLVNAGSGYTVSPKITIIGGGGTGAAATCSIEKIKKGVTNVSVAFTGVGYTKIPTITLSTPPAGGIVATIIPTLNLTNGISSIRIIDPGIGYTTPPTITISQPSLINGIGTYKFNEVVVGSISSTVARVKSWDQDTKILKVSFVDNAATKGFYPGELIVGSASSAIYAIKSFDPFNTDKYSQNREIEQEADNIIDFSESNPFGTY